MPASAPINSATCTIDTCPVTASNWGYQPSLAANVLFLLLNCVCLLSLIIHAFFSRRFLSWMIVIAIGVLMEIVGYVSRVQGAYNPFNRGAYTAQYICLTIAPAFIAAGIYFCLSRIVETFGEAASRLKPKSYPRIFITCDVTSIILQAAGGAYASSAANSGKSPTAGNDIVIVGLVFQCITLALFCFLSLDYALRIKRQNAARQRALDPENEPLRNSRLFKAFLFGLAVATIFIFIRCVYRVVEFSGGFGGPVEHNQGTFIAFESCFTVLAILILNALHPHLAFRIVGANKLPVVKATDDLEVGYSMTAFHPPANTYQSLGDAYRSI